MKMEKTPRYTQRERNMVLGFAAQYKDVIENKRTDAESNRKKDEVWRQIAKEFNARVYHQRSSKQLRQLYKNMKLLLKKDLCGEGKSNPSFMDLLNTLSQQESVTQYISEHMSPSGGAYSNRQQKYDDDFDDSKTPFPSVGYDAMDPDVIVIKSEDISDNEQSQNGGNADDMDDDDDDCLSPKDIPEVCLEEEDDEIFAADLRRSTPQPQSSSSQQQRQQFQLNAQQQQTAQQQQQQEVTIQNVGGIRVGSIGSLANLKALQNGNNSALSITHANSNGNGTGNNNNGCSNNNASNNNHSSNNNSANNNRRSSAEQAQQHLLLNGLGLSAVHPPEPPLPTLQRATHNNNHNNSSNNNNHSHSNNNNSNNLLSNSNSLANQLLLSLSNNANAFVGHKSSGAGASNSHNHNHHMGVQHSSSSGVGSHSTHHSRNNDYLMSLAIEERRRKIDLLEAQIEYWKTLTKKLDANATHSPMPTCACHFPGKVNGLQTPTNSS